MARAKVGDYIKVTDHTDNGVYYRKGAGGKVVEVDDHGALVVFTHGEFNHDDDGKWWIDHDKYTVEKPYSSTFTEPAKAAAPQGHTADGGGLQKHSVGDLYPLAVVGYARDSEHTMWVVENLETGEVACGYADAVWQWPVHALAAKFAEHCKYAAEFAYQGVPIWWVKGRPHFPISHLLSMNTARG